jgi:lysyl-tRNA synthetase class 2
VSKNNNGDKQTSEQQLIEVRMQKAAALREQGGNPFANDVVGEKDGLQLSDMASVRAAFADAANEKGRFDPEKIEAKSFRIAGRILFMRNMGGVAFVRLRDRSGELQLYCDESAMGAEFAKLDSFDLGDFVEGVGTAMATWRGELSINASGVRLLTKAYRPLPTKTTFKDVEMRYRRRYVDLVANPDVAKVFRARTHIVAALRKFLDTRDFLEVETPTMHTLIGGAVAKPFVTHHNKLDMKLFMRIAPELYLKRLVVGGFERVYEIARCYRNEGISTRHNPEFSMLEFYHAYATYQTLMDLTEEMLRFVDGYLAERMPAEHPGWSEARPFTLSKFARVPMHQAIATACERADIDVAEVIGKVHTDAEEIKVWAKAAKAKGRKIDWANYRQGAMKCDNDGERVFCAYEYRAVRAWARAVQRF